jgi:uncharacterized protein involved in exopolysaccharide biosynthesis
MLRLVVFLAVFVAVAGGGVLYDYSRPATYRATSRLSVEPPAVTDDVAAKAQFAVSEAQALRRSELLQLVASRLKESFGPAAIPPEELERRLSVDTIPQTSVIELRAEGADRNQLVAALVAWVDVYTGSRKDADRQDGTEAADEARHALMVAQKAVDDKRREMDSFRQRHGIVSVERDENPGAARLKGLHNSLNDASTREVNAEAKLKAVNESIGQGKGVTRASDKAAISNLELRAVDLRDRLKDLEQDFTAQYLAMDPKYKALRANLARLEQQIEQERDRSQKAALHEAQEEYSGAQRAVQRIREQAEALKQESQSFSTRFVELRRMGVELEQLQEARKSAADRLAKLETARKPAAVKIRVLSAPIAGDEPISPNYARDAMIALGAGVLLALGAVWLMDFLRRDPTRADRGSGHPVIQIAYPVLQPQQVPAPPVLQGQQAMGLLPGAAASAVPREFSPADIVALWTNANREQRLIVAALFAGLSPEELVALRWSNVRIDEGALDILGGSARRLLIVEPLRQELSALADAHPARPPDASLLADGTGNPLDVGTVDGQLRFLAHDAGVSHPEEATGQSLRFTYCAFLARQGIRMTDLVATVGRVAEATGSALMRLAPPGQPLPANRIERYYPAFRAATH